MYPGMMHWWRLRHGGHGCGAYAEHGPYAEEAFGRGRHHGRERRREHGFHMGHHHDDLGAGAFGVRRPLRFLAYKLGLDERQVGELARILDELKTERAQAEVDGRRAMAAFADAVGGEHFDAERASGGGAIRVTTAEHLRDAVTKALGRLHALLEPEQRERLAYLIRTGTLQM
jgi:LTXXQ motif family protein